MQLKTRLSPTSRELFSSIWPQIWLESVLKLNLHLSLVSIFVLLWVLSTYRGRRIFGRVISFDRSRISMDMFLAEFNTPLCKYYKANFILLCLLKHAWFYSSIKSKVLKVYSSPSSITPWWWWSVGLHQMFRVESVDNGVEVINKLGELENGDCQ